MARSMTRAGEDEILRGVYTECSECAQDDNRGRNPLAWPEHGSQVQHDRVRLLSPLMVIPTTPKICGT
jgi:hypothetical protein